jgi:hypothetical protein
LEQRQDGGPPINSIVSALLQRELYERGIKDRMKTENAALKRLTGEIQTTLTEYQKAGVGCRAGVNGIRGVLLEFRGSDSIDQFSSAHDNNLT